MPDSPEDAEKAPQRLANWLEMQTRARAALPQIRDAMTELQALVDTPNATINASPAPYVKGLARALLGLARAALRLGRMTLSDLDDPAE